MNLLGPALLAGLAGLALPLLAHLLGREPPKTVRFAAMRFLPRTEQSVTHRRRLRDLPLLLVRLLLLACLVLILARPASYQSTGVAVVAEVHDAMIVVDGSHSMDLRVDGRSGAELAVERAEALLDSLPSGSRVGWMTSDPGGPRIEPTADPDRVRTSMEDWLERGAPRPGAWTLSEALAPATAMLDELGGERKKVIYAIGDATSGGLAGLPATAPGSIPILPITVPDPDTPIPEHVGLVSVDWTPAPELDPRAVRIQAVVRRHVADESVTGTLSVPLALEISDVEVARTSIDLEPNEDTPVEFTHTLLDEAGPVPATVTIVERPEDPLPGDDARHMWLTADAGLEVLIVNGDPSELRAHDEVFFLTTAISAANEQRNLLLRSMAPDQLESAMRERGTAALRDVDVLVLANVRAPSPDVAPAIIERVEAGMGLWLAVGDRVEPQAYNDRLGELLPLRMREVVQVGTAPGRAEARVEGIAPADLSHPAFKGLGGDLGLSGTRGRKIVLLEPDPDRPHRIALSFTSGAPALLTSEHEQGRVAMLTTTIDRDWADLPLRPGFVPLVTGTLGYLGGARGGNAGSRLEVGDVRKLRSESPVVVTLPGGKNISVAPDDDGFVFVRDTFAPGHYRADTGDDESVFSVEIDPGESDTLPVEFEAREAFEGERRKVDVSVPRWRDLVVLAAALLMLESLLRLWWARRRR